MPLMLATSWAWASTRPMSSAFCSPVEAVLAGNVLRAVAHEQVGGLRPDEGAPGGAVAGAVVAQDGAVAVLGIDGGKASPRALSISPSRPIVAKGKGESSVAGFEDQGGQPLHRLAAGGGDRDGEFRHLALQGIEPETVVGVLLEHPVARAQRPLQRVHPRAVLRIDREHEPVEKAAPVAGGAAKQRVEIGGQPDDAQVLGEGRGRGGRRAVDAADPRGAGVLSSVLDARCRDDARRTAHRASTETRRSPARSGAPSRRVPRGAGPAPA